MWVVSFLVGGEKCYDVIEATDPDDALDRWQALWEGKPYHTFTTSGGKMRVRTDFLGSFEVWPQ